MTEEQKWYAAAAAMITIALALAYWAAHAS